MYLRHLVFGPKGKILTNPQIPFRRKLEKEQRRNEKEAKKIEEKAARKLEKDAAKAEKLYRNTISARSSISRSSERVGRSGSLERRQSSDGEPVLNQTTVHGIASPNRRPTIFDVFRQRNSKTEAKKKDKDAAKASGSDRDNSSGSGSVHGGSGGIMHTIKGAVQHTIGGGHHRSGGSGASGATPQASGTSAEKTKFRDGSAHPHAGSDAQVRMPSAFVVW